MLLRIDDLTRADHSYLDETDQCFYIREYTTEGFEARPDNQRVFNLKCPINHTNANRLYYKRKAIHAAAADLSQALAGLPTIGETVFLPLPPSKMPDTPEYDPRVREMLREAERAHGIRVSEAFAIRSAREAVHTTANHRDIEELRNNLLLTDTAWIGTKFVVLFDDVLVTGAQYKAAASLIRSHDASAVIVGLFWVRRTFP